MINPNKIYSASQTGTITHIETHDVSWAKFTVEYGKNGGSYTGYVSDIPNFKRFKVGDRVKCGMEFSICLDQFLIKRMRLKKV
jgi:hypothetical protein